jgi:hypothetical protein
MKLLTKEILKYIPKQLTDEQQLDEDEIVIYAKYYLPGTDWRWFAAEYNPITKMFFGYVIGPCPEWGSFSLNFLEEHQCARVTLWPATGIAFGKIYKLNN